MPVSVLRIQPSRDKEDPGNVVKEVARFTSHDLARQALIQDFRDNFVKENPAAFGGHIEIHNVDS